MTNDKPRFRAVLDDYLVWMARVNGGKPATVRNHKSTVGGLVDYAGNIYLENLTIQRTDQFIASRDWSVSTRNVKLGILNQFFGWCRTRGHMPRDLDPMYGWRRGRVPEQQRTRIPASEWGSLFAACQYPVERIALATGLYLFLRASEQQAIQMKHINLDAGVIRIHRTKTDEWDDMPISAELDRELRRYLTWYSEQVPIHPDHYLLPPRIVGTLARDES
ncbi:MAG: tyrosine-type recombinase/integrase, partial [Actinomycetales bacterium]